MFNLPSTEVTNYFIYRQKDAIRNSINSFASSIFTHKELQNKKSKDKIDMIYESTGIKYNECENLFTKGFCIYKDNKTIIDINLPNFVDDKDYIEKFLV